MRCGARLRQWLACGTVGLALLAGATAARGQAASQNVAQVFRPEDASGAEKSLASKDASYIYARDASGLPNGAMGKADPSSPSANTAAGFGMTTRGGELPDAPQPRTQSRSDAYQPITGKQRLEWVALGTLGPPDLLAGVIWAGYGTAVNKPWEDGPHWGGFAERYGVRLTGIATSEVMEASFGALWGEDPRYESARGQDFRPRLWSVIKQTFVTRRRDGHFAPAYARYIAVSGNNFLSNTWRPDSEADAYHAGIRTIEGFAGVAGSNAWNEFWPTVHDRLFHRH